MNLSHAKSQLAGLTPLQLHSQVFVRAYNTDVPTVYKSYRLFDCKHSYERGYRFNFEGKMPVLYLACDKDTASYEIGPRTRQAFLGKLARTRATNPYLYIDVAVTAAVLDLTDRQVRRALGVTKAELLVSTKRWDADMKKGIWSITHHLGQIAWNDKRLGGILYPSYPAYMRKRSSGKVCVALFMDKASPDMATPRSPTKLDVVDSKGFLATAGIVV